MARKIQVELIGDASQLQKAFNDVGKSAQGLSGKLSGFAKGAALAGGAAGFGALALGIKQAIGTSMEHQKAMAQTQAALKSTGGAAKVSAASIAALADSIEKSSGMDDLAIQSGENLLLTFRNIKNEAGRGNDVFTQTTKVMADMSAALGQDTKSSALQLGKALNDPIRGVTALQRVGVSFTAAQKDQIAAMVKAGDTMDAQKLILGELNKEFGGSAKAMGETLPGQIEILKARFDDVAQKIGDALLPALSSAVKFVSDHWPQISATVDQVFAAISRAWTNLKPTIDAGKDLLLSVVDVVRQNWPTISRNVDAVKTVIKDAMAVVTSSLKLVTDLLHGDWGAAWKDAKKIVSSVIDGVKAILVNDLENIKGAALAIGKGVKHSIQDGVSGIANWVGGIMDNIAGAIRGAVSSVTSAALGLGKGIYNGIVDGLTGLGKKLSELIVGPINSLISAWNGLSIPGIHVHAGKEVFGKFVGVDFDIPGLSLPDIPKLAAGGIVTAPTLALIGERGPEAVIPLGAGHRVPASPRGAGGGIINITVNADRYLGTREELVRELGPLLNRYLRRNGIPLGGTA